MSPAFPLPLSTLPFVLASAMVTSPFDMISFWLARVTSSCGQVGSSFSERVCLIRCARQTKLRSVLWVCLYMSVPRTVTGSPGRLPERDHDRSRCQQRRLEGLTRGGDGLR